MIIRVIRPPCQIVAELRKIINEFLPLLGSPAGISISSQAIADMVECSERWPFPDICKDWPYPAGELKGWQIVLSYSDECLVIVPTTPDLRST